MTKPASAELVNMVCMTSFQAGVSQDTKWHVKDMAAAEDARSALLARVAAYDAVVAAARIEVARADRFGCKELKEALAALDGAPASAGDEGEQG